MFRKREALDPLIQQQPHLVRHPLADAGRQILFDVGADAATIAIDQAASAKFEDGDGVVPKMTVIARRVCGSFLAPRTLSTTIVTGHGSAMSAAARR